MADYIKFRLTTAKVGVTMALAALITGVAEKAHASSASASNSPPLFVKLGSITGPVRTVLAKIEDKCITLTNELVRLEKKERTDFYTKGEINKVYEKTSVANAKFLPKDGTAANSSKLGSLGPNSFVQGNRAGLATGAVSAIGGSGGVQSLLTLPGTQGAIIVVCQPAPGGGEVQILVKNNTSQAVPAVQDIDGSTKESTLAGGGQSTLLGSFADGSVHQLHLQTFPTGGLPAVITLTVSGAPSSANPNQLAIVGQAVAEGT